MMSTQLRYLSRTPSPCVGVVMKPHFVLKQRLVVLCVSFCLVSCSSCSCSNRCPVSVSMRVGHPAVFVQCCCSMMKYLTTGGLISLMSVVAHNKSNTESCSRVFACCLVLLILVFFAHAMMF
jgi:hypothetical protein